MVVVVVVLLVEGKQRERNLRIDLRPGRHVGDGAESAAYEPHDAAEEEPSGQRRPLLGRAVEHLLAVSVEVAARCDRGVEDHEAVL